MGDIALRWDSGVIDLAIEDDDLAVDDGLQTAFLLALFCHRRAEVDDVLPADDGDRGGWWADQFASVEGDKIGSRNWLLDRSNLRESVLRQAEEFDREALAWVLEDRVAARVDVAITAAAGMLSHAIAVPRPTGDPATYRFAHAWDGEEAAAT